MNLHLTQEDLDHLLTSAVKYAHGRGTYVVPTMIRVVDQNAARMSRDGAQSLSEWLTLWSSQNPTAYCGDEWAHAARKLKEASLQSVEHADAVLDSNRLDLRILFFCAFRYDLELDKPDSPERWNRYADEFPQIIFADNWNLFTARDLLWNERIPLEEPVGHLQRIDDGREPEHTRWVSFFRRMRDGKPFTPTNGE